MSDSTPAIVEVAVRVAQAALFKNGFAWLTCTVDVPAGVEWVRLRDLPETAHGSLQVRGPGEVVRGVTASGDEGFDEVPARTLGELLTANVGREVVLSVEGQEVRGTLLGPVPGNADPAPPSEPDEGFRSARVPVVRAAATDGLVVLQQDGGIVAFESSAVKRVAVPAGSSPALRWKRKRTGGTLRVRLEPSHGPVQLTVTALVRGLAWVPSYRLDLSRPEVGELTGTATLVNDLVDLEQTSLRVVTGFPNLAFASVQSALGMERFEHFAAQLRAATQGGSSSGMLTQQAMMSNAYGPGSHSEDPAAAALLPGESSGDLHYQGLGAVTLARGQRAALPFTRVLVPYSHVYQWDVADPGVNDESGSRAEASRQDVWHSVRLENVSSEPWTTAPLMTVQGERVLGQDTCFYTPRGGRTVVKITKALGLQAEASETELDRKRDTTDKTGQYPLRLTREGVLQLRNHGSEKIDVEVTRTLEGTVDSSTPAAQVVALARAGEGINPKHRLTWRASVSPGQVLKLTYEYWLLARR